jgi:hypothetical protein
MSNLTFHFLYAVLFAVSFLSLFSSLSGYWCTAEILPYFFVYGGKWIDLYPVLFSPTRFDRMSQGANAILASQENPPDPRLFYGRHQIVEWGLLTKYKLLPLAETAGATPNDLLPFRKTYAGFDAAVNFIRLKISIEILYRTIQVNVRTIGKRTRWRVCRVTLHVFSS